MRDRRASRSRRLSVLDDEDPMAGVANLFDVAMVFAVALLVALVSYLRVPELLDPSRDVTITTESADGQMEVMVREGETVRRYRMSTDDARGEGVRLGTAYRLESGEVIYVPEDGTSADEIPAPATSVTPRE